jgi:hypothetical protein
MLRSCIHVGRIDLFKAFSFHLVHREKTPYYLGMNNETTRTEVSAETTQWIFIGDTYVELSTFGKIIDEVIHHLDMDPTHISTYTNSYDIPADRAAQIIAVYRAQVQNGRRPWLSVGR